MKKTKLFTSLAALALVLGLGACETTSEDTTSEKTSESESTASESESTSSETSESTEKVTLSNYTLSIGITYDDELQVVPEYANAYVMGDWDTWAEWHELSVVEGEYQLTFASIEVGKYEFQLVMDYDDTDIGYSYRITDSNASFTISEEDGDGYVNHISVEAPSALEDIIPDPSTAKTNVKVKFDIALEDGTSQEILSYATLRITGDFNNWDGWYECSVDEDGEYYFYTFAKLSAISYSYCAALYYTGETYSGSYYDYKVNGSANAVLTISSELDADGAETTANLTATKALSEILPEPSEEGNEGGEDEHDWELNTEYLFGMDIDGTLYYSDSGAYSSTFFYEGTLTTTYQTAGIFTVSEGDGNGYYITTTYYGTTEYVSLDTYTDSNGNESEYLQFVEEPALIYWDGTNECWTNKDGSYFLGSYLYQSRNEYYLYAQPIESIASYSVASLIEIPATPTTLVISGETEVTAGETIQLTVTANEGAFDAVVWESSNSEIATVAQDGTVSGLKAGSVTISATSTRDANVKAEYAVEVKAAETGVLLEYEITSEKLQAEFGLGTQEDISGKTSTYSGFSVEWTGGNGSGIKPWGSAPNSAGGKDTIRVYSGNSFTIKDGDAHVSKIVIQCSGTSLSSNGCVKLSVDSNATMGSVTSAGTNIDQVEITVNDGATSATITSSGTAYICSIVVYYTF